MRTNEEMRVIGVRSLNCLLLSRLTIEANRGACCYYLIELNLHCPDGANISVRNERECSLMYRQEMVHVARRTRLFVLLHARRAVRAHFAHYYISSSLAIICSWKRTGIKLLNI